MQGEQPADQQLTEVIADFLDMGHVDNIVSLFKRQPTCYALTGELLKDQRFNVRLGLAVLFEELAGLCPEDLERAIDPLLPLLEDENPLVRGEAVSLLGTIASTRALEHLRRLATDPDPQVRELVQLIVGEDQ